jgi:hypothetical protein
MKWIRERDTLIAQTLAFVQAVTGKKDDAGKPLVGFEAAKPDLADASLDAIRNALEIVGPPKEVLKTEMLKTEVLKQPFNNTLQDAPPKSIQIARPMVPSEMQREIQSRVEGFRAHQERFNRERAEYFNATLKRVRASLDEARAANK